MLGKKAPTSQPVLNGQVLGQDSCLAVVHNDKVYWFWGDTNKPSYRWANSEPPAKRSEFLPWRTRPQLGIDLHYFVDATGFSRPMAKLPSKARSGSAE